MRGDWAGESSRCEDPAPTVGRLRGGHCGVCRTDHPLRPHGHQRERRMGGSRRGTLRRYVLRELGESGLNHHIPKGKPRRKTRRGSIVYRRHSLRVERFNHAIQSLEDRSDAARRVVVESTRLMGGGMRGGRYGHGEGGDGTTFGAQWHPRYARL